MLVDIVVYDGVDELDAVGPLEVLRRAQALGADLETRLVSGAEKLKVRGAHDLIIRSDAPFVPGEAEVLVVPGGGWATRAPTGAFAEHERGELEHLLARAALTTRVVCGVCTGVMLIAHAGLLQGRRAVTHHSSLEELSDLGVQIVHDRVVDDGDRVTCGGVTSGIDLALWLVARELDEDTASKIAEAIEYSWFRPTLTRTTSEVNLFVVDVELFDQSS